MLEVVSQELDATPVLDVHTHLFMPALGSLGLSGIDEILTYHYLEAEFFRVSRWQPDDYRKLSKVRRADEVWRHLFVNKAPLSEATRDVVTILQAFDLPTDSADLRDPSSVF